MGWWCQRDQDRESVECSSCRAAPDQHVMEETLHLARTQSFQLSPWWADPEDCFVQQNGTVDTDI